FFFQAEDGIRDRNVTGVQTCALPIYPGEGLTEAEILEIKVAVGDRVEINAPVVEGETAKSAVELSTHVAGTVVAVLVAVGDEVPAGAGLIQVDTSAGAAPAGAPDRTAGAAGPTGDAAEDDEAEADPSAEEVSEQVGAPERTPGGEEPKHLVGYGARSAPGRRRRRRAAPAQQGEAGQVPIDRILAKPPVRKLARDLG